MANLQSVVLSDAAKNDDKQGKVGLEAKLPNSENLVLCKVCGHQNPRNTGMCEMCSNYLFDQK